MVGWWIAAALTLAQPSFGQDNPDSTAAQALPDATELLQGIDQNLQFDTRATTVTMTVASSRRTRVYKMRTFGRGDAEAAIEYLEPARDKGTKMLRQGQEMWMYLPAIERTQKISGHMLRQGMMGSDVSYEDMTAASSWRDQYTAEVTGSHQLGDRACWRVEMKAKDDSVTYPRRIAWVDQQTRIPLKQELYALSGMLLKTWEMSDIRTYDGGRQFPSTMTITDEVQQGSKTTLQMDEIRFGVDLEAEVFSQRWLERR